MSVGTEGIEFELTFGDIVQLQLLGILCASNSEHGLDSDRYEEEDKVEKENITD